MEVLGDSPEAFRGRERVFIRGRPWRLQSARPHQGGVIAKLEGVDSPEAADAFRNAVVEVPESEIPPAPPETYYHFQVMGMNVVTTAGEPMGQVVDILATGSNDVYVVRGPKGQILVPAIADVVKAMDVEAGVMTIEPIPGLL